MKQLTAGLISMTLVTGLVRFAIAGATTQPTAADMILLADRTTQELRNGIDEADQAITIASDDLANAKTTAYKRRDAYPTGEGAAEIRINLIQGALESTGRPLDVGISGSGFFRVKVADNVGNGFAYTRNGNFFISANGELVIGIRDGLRLDPPVTLPKGWTEDSIEISDEGEIFVQMPGATKTQVGQLELSTFERPGKLTPIGGSLYQETEQSREPIEGKPGQNGTGKTLAGFLEASNVNIEQEKLRLRKLHEWRKAMIEAVEEKK